MEDRESILEAYIAALLSKCENIGLFISNDQWIKFPLT